MTYREIREGKYYRYMRTSYATFPAYLYAARIECLHGGSWAVTGKSILMFPSEGVYPTGVGTNDRILIDDRDTDFVEISSTKFEMLWNLYGAS